MRLLAGSWDRYRRLPKALRWLLMGFTFLLSIWIGLDLYGRARLAHFQNHWAECGDELRWHKQKEPEIDPEENFFEAPLLVELREYAEGKRVSYRLEKLDPRLIRGLSLRPYFYLLGLAQHDLPNPPGDLVSVELALTPRDPHESENAQEILDALQPLKPILEELALAAERPKSECTLPPIDDPAFDDVVLSLNDLNEDATLFSLRARTHLQVGNTDAAFKDFVTTQRLAAHLTEEIPLLWDYEPILGTIVQIREVLWEGLNLHGWNDDQLSQLSQLLRKIQLQVIPSKQLKQELVGVDTFYRLMGGDLGFRHSKGKIDPKFTFKLDQLPKADPTAVREWMNQNLRATVYRLAPPGVFHLAIYDSQHPLVEELIAPNFLPNADIQYEHLLALEHRLSAAKDGTGFIPANDYLRFYSQTIRIGIMIQQTLDLAQIAIALERYHLANGNLPADLSDLVPQFIAEIPRDRYDLTRPVSVRHDSERGIYIIYSVAEDQIDDGGMAVRDLIWQLGSAPK
tara:strand:- start:76 stop:1617 length:1542 start_codon:yes stop_codon:yes gene_type:complete